MINVTSITQTKHPVASHRVFYYFIRYDIKINRLSILFNIISEGYFIFSKVKLATPSMPGEISLVGSFGSNTGPASSRKLHLLP
jgi:hypothetical protein